jgi:NADPH-dependent ferric siderophore reductase
MSKHAITRVRHEPRRRLLTVRQVERITPTMARVTLDGDLAGFISASYDDHVKVFFPLPGDTKPTLPDPAPDGATNDAAR